MIRSKDYWINLDLKLNKKPDLHEIETNENPKRLVFWLKDLSKVAILWLICLDVVY